MALSLIAKNQLKTVYKSVLVICLMKITIFCGPEFYYSLEESEKKMKEFEEDKINISGWKAAASIFLTWTRFVLLNFVLLWELLPLTTLAIREFEITKRKVVIWVIVHFLLGFLYLTDCSLNFFTNRTDMEVIFHGASFALVLEMLFIVI
ncbi:unnamed protein product [Orchesella dallaii]|uniref:Transmembrane protein n=1 Tax=Orchesella dallaii TaxID=48710 RepID=A0ABP1Q125_9HEXA